MVSKGCSATLTELFSVVVYNSLSFSDSFSEVFTFKATMLEFGLMPIPGSTLLFSADLFYF